MSIGRSERLVGRERELADLIEWLRQAGAGAGGTYMIAGEPGVGKSRLASEAIAALPSPWLACRGRATELDRPGPFRPIAEALLAASRHRSLPDDPTVYSFATVLGRLVPAWDAEGRADAPVVVVAEAVLRVLCALAQPFPAILLVEDIQWADPETLAALEYLADNARGQPIAIVITVRDDTPSQGLSAVRGLAARRAARQTELARLGPGDVTALAGECLGTAAVDPGVRDLVDRAGGLPFLVEELLSIAVRDGIVTHDNGRWTLAGSPDGIIPETYREMIGRRLAMLPADAALVTRVAAVAGLSAGIPLLSLATGLPPQAVGSAVQDARDAGLLIAGQPGQTAAFRHALARDAVLASLRPGERAVLASRSLDALAGTAAEQAEQEGGGGAGLPDAALELAVDLAEQAGELTRSARLLLALAGRALAAGGLASAEACLRRARHRTGGDPELAAAVDEALVELLAHKGDLPVLREAASAALASLARLGADGSERAAAVHLHVARAATASGHPSWAAEEAGRAQALAAATGNAALRLSADVVTAGAMLAAGDPVAAGTLARQVIAQGEASGAAPGTLVEAWLVAGRADRVHDLKAAGAAFGAAHSLALRHGLPLAELETLHEVATVAMLARGDDEPLLAARARAEERGAVGLVAVLSLQLAGTYALTARPGAALDAADRAASLARRLRQVTVESLAMAQAATAHAVVGDGARMREAADAALALGAGNPDVVAAVWGHAHALHALLREDRAAALDALRRAADVASSATGVHGLFYAPWALTELLAGQPLLSAQLDAGSGSALPANGALLRYARAVMADAEGDPGRAALLWAEAEEAMAAMPAFALWRVLCLRLAAEVVLDGRRAGLDGPPGWADPVGWLRECLAAFDAGGHQHAASACRVLLRRGGVAVPRHGRNAAAPPELARLGITAREGDVLFLVADGLSNREIGERLFLSPRTIEKHVERLLGKTGVRDRSQLVSWAARRTASQGQARLRT